MFDTIYALYQHLDSTIIFTLVAYNLYYLCTPNDRLSVRRFTAVSAGLFFVINNTSTLILSLLVGQQYYYWVFFISFIATAAIIFRIYLRSSTFIDYTYLLFFLTFTQLYKIALSPLYEKEAFLPLRTYRMADLFSGVVLYLLLIALSRMFQRIHISAKISVVPKRLYLILYFPLSILVTILLTVNVGTLWDYFAPILAIIILTNIPIIYYFFTSIINEYEKNQQAEKALNETKMQLSHYRNAVYLQEQIKKERHELKNNYFYIQTLLSQQKYDVLDKYLSETIGEKMERLSEIQTGNILMDYVINRKVQEARKKNIRVYIEILVPKSLHVNEDALCTILLNLLDNAITASLKETDPDIHIAIRCVNEYLAIKIKNRCSENVLLSNPDLATTKSDAANHGYGISIIKETAAKCNGMVNFTYEDGYFQAVVMLP